MGNRIDLEGSATSVVERYSETQLSLSLCCDGAVVAGIVMSADSARELGRMLLESADELEKEMSACIN